MRYVTLILSVLICSHMLIQSSFAEKTIQVPDEKWLEDMKNLSSQRNELRKVLVLQTKKLKEDPELVNLMDEIKSDRKALQEKVKLYRLKRLEKMKDIPEAESIMADLNTLEPQIVEIRQKLRCIEVLQETSSSQ
ncbi:MAG: hypothetical protein ETSY1_25950 [Candidatus Entotheonella factor]|uniref:Uncharacterized protein n=1 Tax=Entotheonella factor TaxID=1429438 RepID=W4LGZ5_ENTF1|nr:hypothetical protein [Candidatus Entotheonella palauensis]ETW96611.1 MAG: hypothetical protein ETSY1_25950 [Candidatus Entotheonella factor]